MRCGGTGTRLISDLRVVRCADAGSSGNMGAPVSGGRAVSSPSIITSSSSASSGAAAAVTTA